VIAAVQSAYICAALSFPRDLEEERGGRLECALRLLREWDLEEEARDVADVGIPVRLAKSSGLTRERDSIPVGPVARARRGEG